MRTKRGRGVDKHHQATFDEEGEGWMDGLDKQETGCTYLGLPRNALL
jgi:hypothetical protein